MNILYDVTAYASWYEISMSLLITQLEFIETLVVVGLTVVAKKFWMDYTSIASTVARNGYFHDRNVTDDSAIVHVLVKQCCLYKLQQ